MALSDATRKRLAGCSGATLSTQLFKRGLRNQVLQNISRLTPKAPTLVGEAFTLRNIPAREDIDHIGVYDDPEHPQRKAIEIAPPGSVLVIDCRGDALPEFAFGDDAVEQIVRWQGACRGMPAGQHLGGAAQGREPRGRRHRPLGLVRRLDRQVVAGRGRRQPGRRSVLQLLGA